MESHSKTNSREERKFVGGMMYGLTAPFVFPNSWGDDFPKETLEKAKLYRLAELPKLLEHELCSEFEAMLYLSCCSLVAPLTHDAYKIMMHCMKKYYGLEKIADKPENLKYLEQDAELQETELLELNKIRRHIFKRQMEVIKQKCRSTTAESVSQSANSSGQAVQHIQVSLDVIFADLKDNSL